MDQRRRHERDLELLGFPPPQRVRKPACAFQLFDQDFDELEKLGSTSQRSIRFPPKARADLNRLLARLCAPEGAKLVPAELTAARDALARVERDAGDLLAFLRKLKAHSEPAMRLAAWRLFPADCAELSITGATLGQPFGVEEASAVLRTISEGARRAARTLDAERTTKRARWHRFFIFVVMEAFEAAGGLARADYQGIKKEPDSPFLRVLCAINERLPKNRRTFESTLRERARRVLAEWRNSQGKKSARAQSIRPATQGRKRPTR